MAGVIEPIGMLALLLRRGQISISTQINPRRLYASDAPKSEHAAVVIKRLRKENKDIFGELLESKQEKVKRERKAKKLAKIAEVDPQSLDPKSDALKPTPKPKSAKEDRDEGLQNESGWALKSFPERSNIIRRSTPQNKVQSFDKVRFPSGQYKIFKREHLPETSRISDREMRALPTLQQLYDSTKVCVDLLPSFERKLVKKDASASGQTKDEDLKNKQSMGQSPEPVVTPNVKIKIDEDRINEEANETSHGEGGVGHPLLTSSSTSSLSSPNPPTTTTTMDDSFPYDNPEKKSTGNFRTETVDEIISFPFPMAQRNSQRESQQPKIPSVSRILNATMSPKQMEILRKWEEKMKAKLGEEGFLRYKEDLFINGKKFHANIQNVLSGKTPKDELVVEDPIAGHWNSLQSIFPKIERVHILESHVHHPGLNYCGIVDCVAVFRDKLVVIDWKTSEKPKPMISMTYDTPLQIAAYIGALNYDPNYNMKVHAGLVVIAYQDGKDCQTYLLNSSQIENYWKQWLKRLRLYQSQSQSLASNQ